MFDTVEGYVSMIVDGKNIAILNVKESESILIILKIILINREKNFKPK